jgi:hypothetical protein
MKRQNPEPLKPKILDNLKTGFQKSEETSKPWSLEIMKPQTETQKPQILETIPPKYLTFTPSKP